MLADHLHVESRDSVSAGRRVDVIGQMGITPAHISRQTGACMCTGYFMVGPVCANSILGQLKFGGIECVSLDDCNPVVDEPYRLSLPPQINPTAAGIYLAETVRDQLVPTVFNSNSKRCDQVGTVAELAWLG